MTRTSNQSRDPETPRRDGSRKGAVAASKASAPRHHIFLLSPANAGGERGRMLLSPRATFDIAARLRRGAATLGETYAFVSGLYFRGKLAYSQAFAAAPTGIPGAFVIVGGMGLVIPEMVLTQDQFERIASIPIDVSEPNYREPLERACRTLDEATKQRCDFVLLGSVATLKYIEPLLSIFGERLLFPETFLGRGDLSRGSVMLRCAREGVPLKYVPVQSLANSPSHRVVLSSR
jgi:hypothetical protein